MGRRTLLVGLAAGLFFATSVAWLAGSAYAAPKVEIKISAEEERPLFKQGVQPPPADEHKWPVQLKIEVACPLSPPPGGLARCVGTVECEYEPKPVGPKRNVITSVTLRPDGTTLQFKSGPVGPAAVLEAEWAFGVVAAGPPFFDAQGNGQALKVLVGAGSACSKAGVPADFIFRGTDTIKSEITNKP